MTNKEQSVAPKERINIVYKALIDGVEEEIELPLRQLVLGEFFNAPTNIPLEKRQTVNVNKDNFNQVLKEHNIKLSIRIPNRLSKNKDETMSVDLKFETMRDFDPDGILHQVPQLQKLFEVREALKSLKGPLGNIPEFRRRLDAIVKDSTAREELIKEMKEKK
ncbi:type VI secretion system contractile sheath small subunit [Legionella maioricensis]|uniref:Type VI secretion system contractile sheath small subunit n=1 Tax=Legionella maioricensis TaxID=2896528 RepID=A0A9X2D3E2_9GAMM|nr:type VI secretion system contractile sheath small subunit [Legionella maioricensis]MCL9684912.1 type VI secretion system contractile sheath small subunit [Legionella maioricensis]MCL9688256.1 type VI secretion system contractile sheath small subunit [Legionella maioricensis]